MRPRYPLLLAALLLMTFANPALASVPSPANSNVPDCLITGPGGNFAFPVTVRDIAFIPISNSNVVIDFTGCSAVVPCPVGANDGYIYDAGTHTIRAFTGAGGLVTFKFRAGGGCSGAVVRVFADGVLLKSVRIASVDQNGDLSVDGADVAADHAKIGTADLSGDVDCSGGVDATDESIVALHVGTSCTHPTESRRGTWGSLKTIYR
jgi:hypothetical protein